MAKFNGNNLVLAVSSTEGSEVKFAHAQNSSVSFSNSLIDTTTKDSDSWEEMISGRKSWTVSADGLADFDDVTGGTSTEGFSDYALAGTAVYITFQRPGTGLSSGDLEGWSGEAYIESFEIAGPSDDVVTYSVSLKGTGALSKVTVS